PLARVAVKRIVIGTRDQWQPEADLVGSYDAGDIHALVDLGVAGVVSADSQQFSFRPGAGVSVKAYEDLRLGAEVFAEIAIDKGETWAMIGPDLAWSHGRTWLSAAYGIGFYHIRDAPRINWGIAF